MAVDIEHDAGIMGVKFGGFIFGSDGGGEVEGFLHEMIGLKFSGALPHGSEEWVAFAPELEGSSGREIWIFFEY
jgi:hypothetical protein